MSVINRLREGKIGFRLLIAVDVLLIGFVGMLMLAKLKKPPVEVLPPKPVIRVEAKIAQPEDVQVFITGYGEVAAVRSVRIAPEVAGKVTRVHPRLVAGRFFKRDEILFEIDKRDYMTAYKDSRITLSRITNTIERLKKEQQITAQRLKTQLRNRDLAKDEFERLRKLYLKSKIGTQSQVDTAERSYNATEDAVAQMTQAVETYPLQIREAEYQLESAKAAVFRASTNLRRCSVRAPFSGRTKEVDLAVGQYVAPGQGLVFLVDDTTLEIAVPIESTDAGKWLLFDRSSGSVGKNWFSDLKQVPVMIQWTEGESGHRWSGRLDRVTHYDKQTRTLTVAVRVDGRTASGKSGGLPLVEGMFCVITIPGKMMRQVYRLPRWAVSFQDTVYLNVADRLKTVPVTVARIQGDDAFVSHGLKTGDTVVITRLVNPLENSLLEIVNRKQAP